MLSQLAAKHSVLTDKLSRVKPRKEAEAIVLDNLKTVAGNFGRPNKRMRVTCQCK